MIACAVVVVVAVLMWPSARAFGGSGASGDLGPPAQASISGGHRSIAPDEVAVVMDLLALSCRSGRSVVDALRCVGEVSTGRARRDLATVVAAIAWGVDPGRAWGLVGPAWSPVALTLTLASRAGVPPAEALVRAAHDLRAEHAQALDLATARLAVTMVLPLGLAFLPAFVALTVVPIVVALAQELVA